LVPAVSTVLEELTEPSVRQLQPDSLDAVDPRPTLSVARDHLRSLQHSGSSSTSDILRLCEMTFKRQPDVK
jgi:hypothetical protein